MSATRCLQRDVDNRLATCPAPPLMEEGVLDHRIRSSLSLAAGMRETPN